MLLLLFCNTECSMIAGALTLYCYHLRWQAGTDQFWYSVFFVCFFNFCCCCYFVSQNVQWLLVLWLSIVITSGGRLERESQQIVPQTAVAALIRRFISSCSDKYKFNRYKYHCGSKKITNTNTNLANNATVAKIVMWPEYILALKGWSTEESLQQYKNITNKGLYGPWHKTSLQSLFCNLMKESLSSLSVSPTNLLLKVRRRTYLLCSRLIFS